MTKQGEIQEGIARIHFDLQQRPYYVDAWKKLPFPIRAIYLKNAEEFLKFLDSKGVVIKTGEWFLGEAVLERLIEDGD